MDPASDFAQMMKNATGGCLFIDEAYRFSPSASGQQPNASNQVLDYLLEAVEKPEIRSTTTVILAGYRDEIETLLAYNVGFASRFNKDLRFPDYNESQLRKIFVNMVKDRGFQLERKKDCGVSISVVMANRIHRGAGKKGFGNAREVRNKMEGVIAQQTNRLGTLKLHKEKVSERDYKLLLAVDAIGVRPDFSRSSAMRELEAMVGLNAVKYQFRNLMMMATQNFDREMRGEKPNLISLHRVFYGNPGTGKTTVARLYGALLKELGYLSNGEFISVTPADLTGDAEGGAATNTKAVLDKAKGKVLLIDEAYILDPKRKNNIYGGNVLDTLVEKLDGDAGSDCAVILAGYRQEMFDMLENNPGLRRRFNIDDFGIEFVDMGDLELREVLIYGVGKAGLAFNDVADIDAVIALIAQKRRLPGFGNAGTVNSIINVAKAAKSKRIGEAHKAYDAAIKEGRMPEPMPNPDLLIRSDFIQNEVDAASARDAFANLYNMDHIIDVLDELEAVIQQAKADGREPADVLADNHMVFMGPPGTGKTTVIFIYHKFKYIIVYRFFTYTIIINTRYILILFCITSNNDISSGGQQVWKALKGPQHLAQRSCHIGNGQLVAGPVCWRDKGKGPQGNASGSRRHLVHRRGLWHGWRAVRQSLPLRKRSRRHACRHHHSARLQGPHVGHYGRLRRSDGSNVCICQSGLRQQIQQATCALLAVDCAAGDRRCRRRH
jgi:SpoVK/Ycf46/Vps4 family AAA+-type ATPase